MAAETGFLIDGTVYEVPTLDSLTMDERHVMYELCGFVPEEFVQEEDEGDDDHDVRVGKMMRHPGFMQTLMQVAYRRGNPTVKPGKAKLVIEATNYFDAIATLQEDTEDEGDDAGPLALTKPPAEPSPSEPYSSNVSSEPTSESGGTDSTNDSDPPAVPPTPIGTSRSATSSPESPPAESVA